MRSQKEKVKRKKLSGQPAQSEPRASASGSSHRSLTVAARSARFPFSFFLFPFYFSLCAGAGDAGDSGRKEPLPDEFAGVELVEHLDAQLPLELEFLDEAGAKTALGSYFNRNRPVLMVLVYYQCPMLCTPLLNGMVDAMREIPLTPGKDYECVIVSFDPLEGPSLARKKKESLLESYARPGAGVGVHLLTGEKANIAKLAAAIGFGFKWVERDRMYAHPASLYVCTPGGRLSQYLKGVAFEPRTLRLSLVEAGQGKIGTATDQLALFCFQYDPSKAKYSLSAIRLMRIAGVITVLFIALGLVWLRGARRSRLAGGGLLKPQMNADEHRYQTCPLSVVRCQLSVVRCPLSVVRCQLRGHGVWLGCMTVTARFLPPWKGGALTARRGSAWNGGNRATQSPARAFVPSSMRPATSPATRALPGLFHIAWRACQGLPALAIDAPAHPGLASSSYGHVPVSLAADHLQLTTDNGQLTTDNGQRTIDAPAHPGLASSSYGLAPVSLATDNGQPTTDNGQPTTDNGQLTTDNGQRTTDILCVYPRSSAVPGTRGGIW